MNIVTPQFIQGIIRNGPLTKALVRAREGTARPKNELNNVSILSSWGLVCEECLDTEHSAEGCDAIVAELTRRGFSDEQINHMRVFAWKTVGWLNFDQMLWEWCSLDEKDIQLALKLQLEKRMITPDEYSEKLSFVEYPSAQPSQPG